MSGDYEVMRYRLRWSTQWNSFNDVYLVSKFDVSSFSVTGDIYGFLDWWYIRIFELAILMTLSSSTLIVIFLTSGKSKLTLFGPFYCLDKSVILLSSGKTCLENRFKPSLFDKNSRTRRIRPWHKSFSVIQSAGIKNWFL